MNIKPQVICSTVTDIALNTFLIMTINYVCDSKHILLTNTGYKLTSPTSMARIVSSLQPEPLAISLYVNHMV